MHGDTAHNAPPPNHDKPYRVSYYNHEIGPSWHGGDFRWYWQANLVSWLRYHVLGQGCNTWHYKDDQ